MAVVTGRIQVRSYNDKDGNRRYKTEVVADNVRFGESKSASSGSYSDYGNSYSAPAQDNFSAPAYTAPAASEFSMLEEDDSDLPF